MAVYVIPVAAALTLLPWVSGGAALIAGIAIALLLGNPWPDATRRLAHRSLTWSVIGLGAGMDLAVVGRVGLHGVGYTAIGIAAALGLGTLLGRRLRVARDASLLVTVGTAICGGSAIAAVAPAIGARQQDVSIALVTVFLLNAIALFAFPAIGHAVGLDPHAFGLWAALAIHDTSSVIGAAAHYGPPALAVATAAKLARALWIVPVTLVAARGRTAPRPWFIAGFVLAAAVVTFVPALRPAGAALTWVAHRLLATTLFLVGLGLTRAALARVGIRPLVQGIALWAVLAAGTLAAILAGWIT